MFLDYAEQPTYARPLAILNIAVGIIICGEGYRIYRIGAFLSALFVIGDYVLALISLGDEMFASDVGQYYATYFCVGSIIGLLALLHPKVSSSITGFCAGVVFIDVILNMAKYSGTLGLYVFLLTLFGLISAILTALTKKLGFVVATSLIGADLLIVGVRYFAFASIYESDRRSSTRSEQLNSAWWSTCAVEIAIFLLAIPLQLLLTARGIDHSHGSSGEALPPQELPQQPPLPPYSGAQYNDHYQHPYNNVQTPQRDSKSSYVTGNPVSHV